MSTNQSTAQEPRKIHLKDYRKPDYAVVSMDLDVDLYEDATRVKNRLVIERAPDAAAKAPLFLHGLQLRLISLTLDGKPLSAADYKLEEEGLTIARVPKKFVLESEVEIKPQENKALEGLYKSGNIFCTQNEPEGFRKITYFLDRSDVMTVYTTTIRADKKKYPVLLANGNLAGKDDLPGGRHSVTWKDPFKKPSYLFALVAGDLAGIHDMFITCKNRKITLSIYVEHGNENRAEHAMRSLKNAMKWDEDTFGLECDLDDYKIVAVDSFNMGAMENKGLNIFNSQYVLADPKTATDANYDGIEGVIGHEYFHNWTGNRVTCRDWFQITLKEGLTVFRDQEFSSDMSSRGVKRINDVRILRDYQFVEDAGPNAHPIRPESYIEVNNFYTSTVYNKGAEVIRMIETFIGKENFRKGMDKYFELYDGQAVTTEDFVHAMELASGKDLTQFKLWYGQAGTPVCSLEGAYDAPSRKYTLTVTQRPSDALPQAKDNLPCHFPLKMGLLDKNGQDVIGTRVLEITKESEVFEFENIAARPVLSAFRGFSAPVKVETHTSADDLKHLLAHDRDAFIRYEASQRLAKRALFVLLQSIERKQRLAVDDSLLEAYRNLLDAKAADPALHAEILSIPSLTALGEEMPVCDYQAAFTAREFFRKTLAQRFEKEWRALYNALLSNKPYSLDAVSVGRRSLKNTALAYLHTLEKEDISSWTEKQFFQADNMTDELTGFALLCARQGERRNRAVQTFYDKWKQNTLVMDKWLGVQAGSQAPGALLCVLALEKDPVFDAKNPNKIRALYGAFSGNLEQFHRANGEGYAFLAEKIITIDGFNPHIAARLSAAFKKYGRLPAAQNENMKAALEKILAKPGLSKDVYEIISKTLAVRP